LYFSIRTDQPSATSQHYFCLEQISTSHQPNEQAAAEGGVVALALVDREKWGQGR
jgi:hypothetical protein